MNKKDTLPTVLDEREQRALLDQPDPRYPTELRNLVLLRMGLDSGLRLREMMNLGWSRLDLSTGKMRVRGLLAKDRVLWLFDRHLKMVKNWKNRQFQEWKQRTAHERTPEDPPERVFTSLHGTPLSKQYVRNMVSMNAVDAGIEKKVSPHVLRHTFAADLFLETGNIRLVQKALGHPDPSLTKVYVCVMDDRMKEALGNLRSARKVSVSKGSHSRSRVDAARRAGTLQRW